MMHMEFDVAAVREFLRHFKVTSDWGVVEDFLGSYYAGDEL